MLDVGIYGCGTIGTEICRQVKHLENVQITCIMDRNHFKADNLAKELKPRPQILPVEEMVELVDIIVECVSREIVFEIAMPALERGVDVMIMSTGALLCTERYKELLSSAEKNAARIYIPSGAVVGIDGIKAASLGGIEQITLTSIKPKKGLIGAPYLKDNNIDLDLLTRRTVLFEGGVEEAISGFPKNVNVAATTHLFDHSFNSFKVRIIYDPDTKANTHVLEVEGGFGKFRSEVANLPHPTNPRTSYLAALSAVATLKKIASPLQLGT